MQVICPYVPGMLHERCEEALMLWAPTTTFVAIDDDESYWRLITSLWGQDFMIVEQDIEIHDHVMPQMMDCGQEWCLFPYQGSPPGTLIESGLGCTRFSAALGVKNLRLPHNLAHRHWNGLDAALGAQLVGAGFSPHVHQPPVTHHRVYSAPRGVNSQE